jgi:hypothetical protein
LFAAAEQSIWPVLDIIGAMHTPFPSRIMPAIHPAAPVFVLFEAVIPPMNVVLLHCSTVYTPPLQFIIVEPEDAVPPPAQAGLFAEAGALQSIAVPPAVTDLHPLIP